MDINDNYLFDLFTNRNYDIQTIKLPSNKELIFKALISSETDPDLTGQILWPGCKLLLTWIDKNIDYFDNKKIVELGSGIAICSLFIAKYGKSKKIVTTDGSDIVIDLIKENSKLAGCDNVECELLSWGRMSSKSFVEEHETFDIVMGSEIAYNENCIDALVITVNELLSNDGVFIIGHIDRYGQVTRYFFNKLHEYNLTIERSYKWDDIMDYRMELIEGSVYIIRRK